MNEKQLLQSITYICQRITPPLFFMVFYLTGCNESHSLPKPNHVLIVILENRWYSQIIGSNDAPYINYLAKDSFSANFTNSFALTHPSQPNYLNLFSGSDQGVRNNKRPQWLPFNTPNLGKQLIDSDKTYITYCENLPFTGFNEDSSGLYVRKHNPSTNWIGTGPNQIPATTNQPFSEFPKDFSKLPTVCIVVPNLSNDMHDGSIKQGDSWLRDNLNNYIQWTKKNNSLFVLTFDEDDGKNKNQIVTIFTGQMVKGGQYVERITHYNVLRTIEDMYRLPYAGNAVFAKAITDCWR